MLTYATISIFQVVINLSSKRLTNQGLDEKSDSFSGSRGKRTLRVIDIVVYAPLELSMKTLVVSLVRNVEVD